MNFFIVTRKKFREMVDKKNKEIADLHKIIANEEFRYFEDYLKEQSLRKKLQSAFNKLKGQKANLTREYNKLFVKFNEAIRQVGEATKKYDFAMKEIADLKSDRYLKIGLPKEKSKNTQKMQIKSSTKQSRIIKKVSTNE